MPPNVCVAKSGNGGGGGKLVPSSVCSEYPTSASQVCKVKVAKTTEPYFPVLNPADRTLFLSTCPSPPTISSSHSANIHGVIWDNLGDTKRALSERGTLSTLGNWKAGYWRWHFQVTFLETQQRTLKMDVFCSSGPKKQKSDHLTVFLCILPNYKTVLCHLTMGMQPENCIAVWLCHSVNIAACAYTNQDGIS
jgi:hypothetical protein